MRPLVAVVTDFGSSDSYVGELELAARAAVPDVAVVHVAHAVRSFDRVAAALVAERTLRGLPRGAALVVVVDPGGGTERARIAVEQGGRWLVGPDNGTLPEDEAERCFAIDPARWAPAAGVRTFDGRELFAPVGALLAAGMRPEFLGARCARSVPSVLGRARAAEPEGVHEGVVVALDTYGNAVTELRAPAEPARVEVLEPLAWAGPLVGSYGAVPRGATAALWGSSGRLELARREAPSGLERGAIVRLRATRVG